MYQPFTSHALLQYQHLLFSVNFDNGLIKMNKLTPAGVHDFKTKVHDFRVFTKINATATVQVVVEEITDEAIFSSGSIRFSGNSEICSILMMMNLNKGELFGIIRKPDQIPSYLRKKSDVGEVY